MPRRPLDLFLRRMALQFRKGNAMRWFSKKAADKIRKQKIRIREKPKAPSGQNPEYTSPEHRQRAPKIKKPRVQRPFVTEFSSMHVNAHAQDMSTSELDMHDKGEAGPITSIIWRTNGGGCPKCAPLNDMQWESLGDFLAGREIASAPKTGKPVALYGYTHPECSCWLELTLANSEETVLVGPYA